MGGPSLSRCAHESQFMRHIGTIPDLEKAQLFVDYLAALEIDAITESQGSEWAVWVRDEDALSQSREELKSFLADSGRSKFEEKAATVRAARKRAQDLLVRRADELARGPAPGSAQKNPGTAAGKNDETDSTGKVAENVVPPPVTMAEMTRRAPLTMIVIYVCTFVFLTSQFGSNMRSVSVESFAFCNPQRVNEPSWQDSEDGMQDIRRGEFWRMVTPSFLHFGLAHLGLNLFFLFHLGRLFEVRNNTMRMGIILLVCALVGNIGQYICDGWPLFGGMSGAVSGLLAYMSVRTVTTPNEGPKLAPVAVLMILLSIGLAGSMDQLDNDTRGNDVKIANWAQLFGVVAGGALAVALPKKDEAEVEVEPDAA